MSEVVDLYFPDRKVQWTPQRGTVDQTDIEESGGREQRRVRMPLGGRRTMTGDLEFADPSMRETLRDFVRALRGRYMPFWIYAWDPEHWTGMVLDAAYDSANLPYVLPFVEVTDLVVYGTIGGSAAVFTVLTDSGGPNGETRILDFNGPGEPPPTGIPPDNGTAVYCSFIGRTKMAVRMMSDKQAETFVRSSRVLAIRHIDVIEILNAVPGGGPVPPFPPPEPPPAAPLTLIYAESTLTGDGINRTFPFLLPMIRLLTGYIGGQAQRPEDCTVVGGELVFGSLVAPPEAGEKVTASYWI